MALMAIEGNPDIDPVPGAGRHAGRGPAGPQIAILLCAKAFSVDLAELRSARRGRAQVALARQAAAYLCHVTLGMAFEPIGRALSRDRTTIAHACHHIEDLRDESRFDALMLRIEAELADLVTNACHLRLCAGKVDQ